MKAMVFTTPGKALELRELLESEPGEDQAPIRVHVCGVCRTDLEMQRFWRND